MRDLMDVLQAKFMPSEDVRNSTWLGCIKGKTKQYYLTVRLPFKQALGSYEM